jgi:hypothetical protein
LARLFSTLYPVFYCLFCNIFFAGTATVWIEKEGNLSRSNPAEGWRALKNECTGFCGLARHPFKRLAHKTFSRKGTKPQTKCW